MSTSNTTRDHDQIRRWAEARGAVPSEVASTDKGREPGILRFHFPNAPGEKDGNLRKISWDAFFEKFDKSNLELVYQEKTAEGERSNFNKLVHAEESSSSRKTRPSGKKKASSASKTTSKSIEDEEDDEEELEEA